MTNFIKKAEALALRKQEFSYSQIKQKIGVSKSTLSDWLKDYPLSKERIAELRDHNEQKIERYRETMRKKREERVMQIYKTEKKIILPFNRREIFIFGLGLYWGEGSKSGNARLSISNTDPSIIKFFILWIDKSLNISKEKLKVHLQLYNDMDIEKEICFWEQVTAISKKQFIKPYIKTSSLKAINHKGGFGHGTCNIHIGNARLSEKILTTIKVIADKYAMRT
jgi:hypothetical protein